MISFKNPFKKEDTSFKLDEYSLPSLGETNTPNTQVLPGSDPTLNPSVNPSNDLSSQNNLGMNSSLDASQPSMTNSSMDTSLTTPTPSFASTAALPSSFTPEEPKIEPSISSGDEVLKAKIEAIEAKLSLAEARNSKMEHTVELIYEMLLAEISDETKKKLKLKNMMDSIK